MDLSVFLSLNSPLLTPACQDIPHFGPGCLRLWFTYILDLLGLVLTSASQQLGLCIIPWYIHSGPGCGPRPKGWFYLPTSCCLLLASHGPVCPHYNLPKWKGLLRCLIFQSCSCLLLFSFLILASPYQTHK